MWGQRVRIALGVSYRGSAYQGWQSQPSGMTVQDRLEAALAKFAGCPLHTSCAGRTDAAVHALNQVVHFDTEIERESVSWVRGTNRYLPRDIAVQWCRFVTPGFHSRASARGRRYAYLLLESPVRPALEVGLAGWSFRALDGAAMQAAARHLVGEHDFSAFRSAQCQAKSPIKTLRSIRIERHGAQSAHSAQSAYWRFDFDASAFLHHMVRNVMGCLVAVGTGIRPADWMAQVLASRQRAQAAPTFAAEGLYFLGPYYDADLDIPRRTPAMDWLVGSEPKSP
jgi:tRNA pseudouridine38-40 synthase